MHRKMKLKKAYRKLSVKFHSDKNDGDKFLRTISNYHCTKDDIC